MGRIRESARKQVCFFIKKCYADIAYEQLQQLNKIIKKEWITQENCAENFYKIEQKIIFILDNASYHKRQNFIDKIDQ
jgi:hypothetical protein